VALLKPSQVKPKLYGGKLKIMVNLWGNLPNTKRNKSRMGRFFPGRLPWWPKNGPAVFDFIHPDIENALFLHHGIGFVNRFI